MFQAPRAPQPVSVRPDYGLTGAMVQAQAKSPYERTMRPGETRSAGDLQDMLAEVILAAGGAVVPGVGPRGAARRPPAARTVLRPKNWNALGDEGVKTLDSLKRPGHVYRGMEAAEYEATVGAGQGAKSSGRYSHKSEGTNFATHPADAESYVNFGRSDPRKTGRDTFIVEALQTPEMTVGRDGYVKAPVAVTPSRVWRIRASDGALILEDI